ncbi:hypothetical protein EVAR_52354_1 [Eumeta japonica]|uniref:Uncharacterized protein n=1 Tax=Eumeta variegata TaxID=151549 RepID=A0A4C1YSY3_EUMVA|nr:hypothetical protein EVAR_52354_1 [Eumeta japonica]
MSTGGAAGEAQHCASPECIAESREVTRTRSRRDRSNPITLVRRRLGRGGPDLPRRVTIHGGRTLRTRAAGPLRTARRCSAAESRLQAEVGEESKVEIGGVIENEINGKIECGTADKPRAWSEPDREPPRLEVQQVLNNLADGATGRRSALCASPGVRGGRGRGDVTSP